MSMTFHSMMKYNIPNIIKTIILNIKSNNGKYITDDEKVILKKIKEKELKSYVKKIIRKEKKQLKKEVIEELQKKAENI